MFPCNVLGFYMYTEASSPRSRGDKARLISQTNPATTGSCLEFYYHMFGTDIGTLNVYARVGSSLPSRPLWSENGNQGNVWKVARKTITTTQPFEVNRLRFHFFYSAIFAICFDVCSVSLNSCHSLIERMTFHLARS